MIIVLTSFGKVFSDFLKKKNIWAMLLLLLIKSLVLPSLYWVGQMTTKIVISACKSLYNIQVFY